MRWQLVSDSYEDNTAAVSAKKIAWVLGTISSGLYLCMIRFRYSVLRRRERVNNWQVAYVSDSTVIVIVDVCYVL